MRNRSITEAEIEAARQPSGRFTKARLRAWNLPIPKPENWRERLQENGVPKDCPYPRGFEPTPAPASVPLDTIEIFTDGSCKPNPGAGGWGFAAYRGRSELHAQCGGDIKATNGRMELCAVIAALRWLNLAQPAIVWCDAQYVVGGCTEWRHGWRRQNWRRGKDVLANAELWQVLDALLDARNVEVRWTRGHVGTVGNERADELAALGRAAVSAAKR